MSEEQSKQGKSLKQAQSGGGAHADQEGTPAKLPSDGKGVHAKEQGEQIQSRSADPGQSSYGGFHNEDPSRQAQDLKGGADTAKSSDSKKGH